MVNQFSTQFDSFLSHSVEIRRENGFSVNTWGEIIPDASTLINSTTARIEPAKSKNLTTMLQGKEVIVTHKGFFKSTEDISENDVVKVISTNTEYLVLLVNNFYDEQTLDHREVFMKETDNL